MNKLPSSIVEPVPGTLVNYLAMRRGNTRRIKQANKCMLMDPIAYNLKKRLEFTTKKLQTNVAAMHVKLQVLFLNELSPYTSKLLLIRPRCLKEIFTTAKISRAL